MWIATLLIKVIGIAFMAAMWDVNIKEIGWFRWSIGATLGLTIIDCIQLLNF